MADEEHAEKREEVSELAPFDPTKKKIKKKVVIQDPSNEVDNLAEKTESLAVSEPGELNFTGMQKKKQVDLESSIAGIGDGEDTLDDHIGEDEEGDGIVLGGSPWYPWEGTDTGTTNMKSCLNICPPNSLKHACLCHSLSTPTQDLVLESSRVCIYLQFFV